MKKELAWWFCGGLIGAIIFGALKSPSATAMADNPLLPFEGFIMGVLMGAQYGLFIPLVAWLTKRVKSQRLYFVDLFAMFSGVTIGIGILFVLYGFFLGGLFYIIGELLLLCVCYKLACWLWKRNLNP